MIKTQTCFVIRCDLCGGRLDYDGEPHWDDADDARSTACGESEWWHDGTTDVCYDCRSKPHEFIADPAYPGDECWRCGNPADEHEPTAVTP